MLAMMRARRSFDAGLGDRWVLAGHSEGSMAALFASVAEPPDAEARLLGTAAFTPVTRMPLSIGAARVLGARAPGAATISALMGLMLSGAATEDERLRELIEGDGLSPEARAVLPHIDSRTLIELTRTDSWGGVAPRRIGGAQGAELWRRLFESQRRNEVAALRPRADQPPLRIDVALFDEVAPASFTHALLRSYRKAGSELTSRWWPTHHSGAMRDQHAPSEAAAWIKARFNGPPAG